MHARRTAPVLVAALLASACGPSKEEERVKRLQAICEGAVGKTVYDLEIEYAQTIRLHVVAEGGQLAYSCGTDISTLDQCTPGPARCVLGFWFPPSNDPATCERTGCYFTCDVRAEQEDLKAHQEDHLATVCGTRWVQGQPTPGPFYYDPLLTQVTIP